MIAPLIGLATAALAEVGRAAAEQGIRENR